MNEASVSIALKIGYEDLPLPESLSIPLQSGHVRFLRKIHYTPRADDPVKAQFITLRHAHGETLRLDLQLAGTLDLDPGGSVDLQGASVGGLFRLVLEGNALHVKDVKLKSLSFRRLPKMLQVVAKGVLNRVLVPRLTEALQFDLEKVVSALAENIIANIDAVPLEIGGQTTELRIQLARKAEAYDFEVTPEGTLLTLHLNFTPHFDLIAPPA